MCVFFLRRHIRNARNAQRGGRWSDRRRNKQMAKRLLVAVVWVDCEFVDYRFILLQVLTASQTDRVERSQSVSLDDGDLLLGCGESERDT